MSTRPRRHLLGTIARALRGLTCEHDEHIHACPECAADAVLAALDLDARDARVRAEAWAQALSVVEQSKPESSDRNYRRGLEAYRSALVAGLRIAQRLARRPAGPSSSPVDAPSRPNVVPIFDAADRAMRDELSRWTVAVPDELRLSLCRAAIGTLRDASMLNYDRPWEDESPVDAPSRPTATPGPDPR